MAFLHLTTFIEAPCERVFDLSRHVSVHKQSMAKYRETIVNSISGLMDLNDEVIWKARHFFKDRMLTVRIGAIKKPSYFMDEQVKGDFKIMRHEHYFKPVNNGTLMIDQFNYEIPLGVIGRLADKLYIEKYIKKLLLERNAVIKQVAESNQWKQYLNT
jgi:ligand-binding SRPBCC domain-containing protein